MIGLSEYLTGDHACLDALLAAALSDERSFGHEAFEQFRAGLLRHIGIEEKILLPAVRRLRGEPLAIVETLRIEHAALASLLVPMPDHALAREIGRLLRQHNAREEGSGGLYDICRSLLGDEAGGLEARARSQPSPPLARHFDGDGVFRTAEAAVSAARRAVERRRPR